MAISLLHGDGAELKAWVAKFVKFGIVGFSGMILDYAVLFVLKEQVGVPALWANAVSFTVAATSNYMLNRWWTFRSKEEDMGAEYLRFFLVSLVGLGISTATLWVLGLLLPVWNDGPLFYLLKFIAIVITTLWNFFGNMMFTFRSHRRV